MADFSVLVGGRPPHETDGTGAAQPGTAPAGVVGRLTAWFRALTAHWRTFWPVLLGAAVSAATTSFPVRGALPSSDESVYAYVGWMIDRGHMPYTDAWDNKGPLTYLLYAVGTGLDPDHGMFGVAVLNLLVVAVLAYRLALVLARPAVAGPVVGVALAVLVHSPELTEALSLGFLLYLALVATRMLVADVPPTPVQAALAGACVAASTLLRANNVFSLVPLCLVACVWLARRSMSALVRALGWLAVGAVAVTTPIVVWLWRGGALGACLDAAYVGSLRWDLGWTTRVANTALLLGSYGVAPVAVWLALLVLTVRRAGRTSHRGLRWVCWASLGGLGVFLVANMASTGTRYSHYLVVLLPLTLVAVLVVLGSARDWFAGRTTAAGAPRTVALVTATTLVLLAPQLPGVLHRATVPYDTSTSSAREARQLVTYVQQHSAPDDKVLVLDFTVFGAQYRRESPTPYYLPNPLWSPSVQEQIWQDVAADVQADRPALIVFGDAAERDRFLDALPAGTRADVQALLADYRQVAPVGDYVVYQAADG